MEKSKPCQRCSKVKNISDFHIDKSRKDGHSYVCKSCRKSERRERYLGQRQHLINHYDSAESRDKRLRYKYGISQQDYLQMYESQDGRCAICTDEHESLFIDHCHETGRVRGLLCHLCNSGIGSLRDSIDNLKRAIRYIEAVE